jgi:hypothetical protein
MKAIKSESHENRYYSYASEEFLNHMANFQLFKKISVPYNYDIINIGREKLWNNKDPRGDPRSLHWRIHLGIYFESPKKTKNESDGQVVAQFKLG